MNTIKKVAGIIWIVLGPAAIWYLIKTAIRRFRRSQKWIQKSNGPFLSLSLFPLQSGWCCSAITP